jgi:Fe(3+) dicitrate transport protein
MKKPISIRSSNYQTPAPKPASILALWASFTVGLLVFHAVAQSAESGGTAASLDTLANSGSGVTRLDEVTVTASYLDSGFVGGPFLPDVEDTRINAGKKTSNISLENLPQIENGNYRQLIAQTPGLVLAEETTPLVSVGYRGYEPHRMQYFQVLKNGFPIHADMIGYPEAYYRPSLEAVERLEFIRGGAALMYGPQPAGAINFVMKNPPLDRQLSIETTNVLGSFGLYTNFTQVGGTLGRFGYGAYYNHRQADGFREANSDYFLNEWSGVLALDAAGPKRWFLYLDAYDETHGEPGGLTLATGPGAVNYTTNRKGTSRFYDRMRISRYAVSLLHENELSDTTLLTVRTWWNYYRRWSARQRGGGFGTLPTGPAAQTNSIETQQFYNWGLEPRFRHDYTWLGQDHTVSIGAMLYQTYSPRMDSRGNSPTAMRGEIRSSSDRYTNYFSVFAENLFRIGNLSVVPGVRLESIWQTVKETANVERKARGLPLQNETNFAFVPLFGLGLEYAFTPQVQVYSNVSQAYRPVIFTQAVPTSPNFVVDGTLKPSFVWNYEIGFRGEPTSWITWDTSLFLVDFQNQIGTRTANNGNLTILENAGRSVTFGWDISLEVDFVGLAQRLFDPMPAAFSRTDQKQATPARNDWRDTWGSLKMFTNLTLMNSRFVSGPNDGNVPQNTPEYLYRLGLVYNWREKIKVSLMSTFSGSSYADASNTPSRFIPAYDVWDLTLEARVYKDFVSVIAGVNNLFDRDYYSRIRADGIDPAAPRNWYAGVKLEF